MNTPQNHQIDFGNWVPLKMITAPLLLGLIGLGLGVVHWAFLIAGGLFLAIAVYFGISWWLFSPRGGNVQDQVEELVLSHLTWSGQGQALDVGCGNGPLSIKLAHHYPGAKITGLDYWGKNWDYSRQVCAENARLSGVAEQITFRHGSASHLPFEDASFDLVVSNLTFHEVRDAADKRQCIREALRVLKPGGVFVLQDLFLLNAYYGTPDELLQTVRACGVQSVEFIRTCDAEFIPGFVKLPFMVGTLAILRGVK